jgi:DNA-binding CsgD family transcriptional regulator
MAEMPLDRLTDRQKDCLGLVAQGYTSKEIGRQLGLSPSTVDNHVLAAMQMLQASSRGAAARILASGEDRQKMPSQSPPLAEQGILPPKEPAAEAGGWTRWGRFALALPPLGGQDNDLDWTERTFRIFQVAVLSLGLLLSLTMVIAGTFAILD